MEKINRPGYVLVLTLLITASIIALLTSVVQRSFAYQRRARVAREFTHARLLGLSSLEIARSLLSTVEAKEDQGDKQQEKQEKEMLEPVQKWLLKVLPSINRWQTITIEEEGLSGTIELYLACEEGKINLAAFKQEGIEAQKETQDAQNSDDDQEPSKAADKPPKQDKKQAQQAEGSALTALDELFKKVHDVSMYEAFKRFIGEQRRIPEDPTELLRVPFFAKLHNRLFTPRKSEHRGLYIMDLFTVRHDASEKINPWLLTASSKTLLGIRESDAAPVDEEFVKHIKPRMNWQKQWDEVLAPRYAKNYAAFDPAIQRIFAESFEAKAFSVVSYCTVGSVTQKLYAVLEVAPPPPDLSPKSVIFRVKKLYWL